MIIDWNGKLENNTSDHAVLASGMRMCVPGGCLALTACSRIQGVEHSNQPARSPDLQPAFDETTCYPPSV